MQFPVPQFTEVEDKIIGPLTLKQFGIFAGAGMFIFLGYAASGKNMTVLIIMAIFIGVPALAIAFYKFNGRPIYNTFGNVGRFITSQKVLVFHKEVRTISSQAKLKDAQVPTAVVETKEVGKPQDRLKEVRELLSKQENEEKELLGKIH
jgi:hypothetical protein